MPGVAAARSQQAWLWTYLANVDIAAKNAYVFGSLNHFWSLAVEEQFYLLWPLVVCFCHVASSFGSVGSRSSR